MKNEEESTSEFSRGNRAEIIKGPSVSATDTD